MTYSKRPATTARNLKRLMLKNPPQSTAEVPTDLANMLPPPVPSIVSMAVGAVLRGHNVAQIVAQTRMAHSNRRQMKQFLSHRQLLVGPKGELLD